MRRLSFVLLLVSVLSAAGLASAQSDEPIVRAVLFYSPTCGHCHSVITEALPPLAEQYGVQLQIVLINASTPQGSQLYNAATQAFDVPPERRGVPALVIGSTVLVGSVEIPQQLPDLVERGLAAGGLDWPPIPNLREMLVEAGLIPELTAQVQSSATPVPEPTDQPDSSPTSVPESTAQVQASPTAVSEATSQAPPTPSLAPATPIIVDGDDGAEIAEGAGEADGARMEALDAFIAVSVLVGLAATLVLIGLRLWAVRRVLGRLPWPPVGAIRWLTPALTLVGLVVASYLACVEVTQVKAVCGPVGDCNAVQCSPYARVFGLVPVAALGVLGYLVILAVWVVGELRGWRAARWCQPILLVLNLFGVAFSTYLTFLELFVIRALCMWCTTSAVTMGALVWISALSLWRMHPAAGLEIPTLEELTR
jgi:uncharacterized membrane protein/thiol-disulfide isomerase/thioredoxin